MEKVLLKNVRQSKVKQSIAQDLFDEVADLQSDSFLGLGKKARVRKDAKKSAKTDIKQARADRIRNEGQAKIILANQGIASAEKPNVLQSITGALGGIVGSLTGGGSNSAPVEQSYQEQPQQYVDGSVQRNVSQTAESVKTKSNTLFYVGIAAVAAIVLLMLLKKK